MSRYADRITEWTPQQKAAVKQFFAEGRHMIDFHRDLGITYPQCQTLVHKMRREGLLPPGRVGRMKRTLVPGEKPPRKQNNAHGARNDKQGIFKWVPPSTPPLNGPLIAKIGKEKPGPNAKTFAECNGCMWPVAGDLYCGEPKDGGRQPYCAEHRKRGTQPYKAMKKPVDGNGERLLKSLND